MHDDIWRNLRDGAFRAGFFARYVYKSLKYAFPLKCYTERSYL